MPPSTTTEFAPAKINLALHLTGLRDDGYHLLESLVVFADVGDVLTVAAAKDLSLIVTGPKAAGVPIDAANLVLKAAHRLRDLRGVMAGAAITLEKHLPHGGGIGGGSSDAACALRLLSNLWNVSPLSIAEALPLGADLPVCMMAPSPMIMTGIGESLIPAPPLPVGWLVLVNPGVTLPTRAVFAEHDKQSRTGGTGLQRFDGYRLPLNTEDFSAWLGGQRNDLTKIAAAPQFAPVIGDILAMLQTHLGVSHADMSGSGSTCWGWFSVEANARLAAAKIAAANPAWWVVATRVLSPADQLIRATT